MSHYKGSCLCGGVTFEIDGDVRDVLACHCIQCRKTTGNYTPGHKRGFCNRCGSSLFWQPDDRNYLAICAGTIDGKLGKKLAGHIYCDFAGDYYEISGGDFQKGER